MHSHLNSFLIWLDHLLLNKKLHLLSYMLCWLYFAPFFCVIILNFSLKKSENLATKPTISSTVITSFSFRKSYETYFFQLFLTGNAYKSLFCKIIFCFFFSGDSSTHLYLKLQHPKLVLDEASAISNQNNYVLCLSCNVPHHKLQSHICHFLQ